MNIDNANLSALFEVISEIAANITITSEQDEFMPLREVGKIVALADLGNEITSFQHKLSVGDARIVWLGRDSVAPGAAEKLDQVAAICERTSTDAYDRLDEIAGVVDGG